MNTEQGLSMADFVPAEQDLMSLATKAKKVDITNAEQVHETRLELRDARIQITKTGKDLRDSAVKFQKSVIQREKELIAIITPDEERLLAIEEEFKLKNEMDKRRGELQSRIDALVAIGDELDVDERILLSMDDNEFNAYRLRRIEAKIIADKAANEAKLKQQEEELIAKRKLEEDAIMEARAKEEAIIAAKRAEEDKMLAELRKKEELKLAEERQALKLEQDRINAEKERIRIEEDTKRKIEQEQQDRINREKELSELEAKRIAKENEAKQQAQAEREKEAKFTKWLADNTYNSVTDKLDTSETSVKMYRLVAEYKYE